MYTAKKRQNQGIIPNEVSVDQKIKFQGLKDYMYLFNQPLDVVKRYLPEDPVIMEAGAHYGTDTLKLAAAWPKGRIHAFEPNPHAYQVFCAYTRNCKNVQGYNLALGEKSGKVTLHVCHGPGGKDPIYEGASSLLESSEEMKHNYMGPDVEVNCVVFDDWCKENQVASLDFMWLDLEGMELQILRSSPEILKTVKVVFTETNFREFRLGMTQYGPLRRFLEESGFQLVAHWFADGAQGNAIFVRK